MATNVYFNGADKSEQNLYEDLIIESISIYGQDVYYVPRVSVSKDDILNEDYSKFTDGYVVEMYIENVDAFEGEGDLLSKFGVEIRDQATFVVAKRRWERQVGTYAGGMNNIAAHGGIRPMEGDLLFLPMTQSLFEIKFVEHEQPFYQLQNLPVYKLQAELFEYSDEILDTGIDAIDVIERTHATLYNYTLQSGSGTFEIGETVTQWTGENDAGGEPINIEAEIAGWEPVSSTAGALAVIAHVTSDGKFRQFYVSSDSNKRIVGTESGAVYDCGTVVATGSHTYNEDDSAQNAFFETDADLIIDFTEENPFGMP